MSKYDGLDLKRGPNEKRLTFVDRITGYYADGLISHEIMEAALMKTPIDNLNTGRIDASRIKVVNLLKGEE